MNTRKEIKYIISVAVIFLIIATFADLQISHALVNPDSVFGKIFETIGEMPAALIASFGAMGLLVMQENRWKRIGLGVMSAILSIVAAYFPLHYLDIPRYWSIILAVIFLGVEYKIALVCKGKNVEKFKEAAKIGLEMFLISTIIYQSMKFGWGRERYRHMAAAGSFEGFSLWLIPQRIASGNEFMSFPSGHSANAAMMIWITLIPNFIDSCKSKETLLKMSAFAWMLLVMFSRIVVGAHFLSDVTVGASVSLVVFYWLSNPKRYKK